VQLQKQLDHFRSTPAATDEVAGVTLLGLRSNWPGNTAISIAHPLRLDYMELKKRLAEFPSSDARQPCRHSSN
jgi:hypothetical protein